MTTQIDDLQTVVRFESCANLVHQPSSRVILFKTGEIDYGDAQHLVTRAVLVESPGGIDKERNQHADIETRAKTVGDRVVPGIDTTFPNSGTTTL